MSIGYSTDTGSAGRSNAVSRLFGGLRGWLGEEIHAIRAAQLDDAFFATEKGTHYRPTPYGGVALGDSPSSAS